MGALPHGIGGGRPKTLLFGDTMTRAPSRLEVHAWGAGPRVLLVHGNILNGPLSWSQQRPLAERWRLEVLNRRGYGQSPPTERQDFAVDARDIADLLAGGAHLVGHSYGGIGALLAAAAWPQAVRSLTVIEPPVFRLAHGHAAADALAEQLRRLQAAGPADPAAYAEAFVDAVGGGIRLPHPLPRQLDRGVRVLMAGRGPWEAEVPLAALRGAPFRKLVVSGGHHAGLDAICDTLAREIAAEHAVIAGEGHNVPRTGARFNARLEAFLRAT